MFHEDQPGYPSRIVQELHFEGKVDRKNLEDSIREITSMHPLLTALVDDRSFGTPHWLIDDSRSFPIHWHHQCPLSFKPDLKRFDITREVALEIHVIENQDRWNLLLNISHVICDGVASSSFLHDILLAYDNRFRKAHKIRPSNPNLLRQRNQYGLSFTKKIALLPAQIAGLALALTLIRRKVSPLSPVSLSEPERPQSENSPHIVSRKLDRDRYSQFQELAQQRGKSVNDYCIAFLHTAIGSWRKRQGIGSIHDWIRISIPKNLRPDSGHDLPACNVISIVPIDRQSKGLNNRTRLLKKAHEDMTFIKKGRLALTFLAILWIHRLRPNGIRRMSHRDICRTTTVLSNIGRIFRHSPLLDKNQKLKIENATLQKVVTVAPFRPRTNFTLFLSVYAEELYMDLNYDPQALTKPQAVELLNDFIAEIASALKNVDSRPGKA